MTSILTIGDMHCKASNLQEFCETADAILDVARRTQPNLIIALGDLNDGHEKIHSSCLSSIEHFLDALGSISDVSVLIGNHDLPSNNLFLSKIHHFNSFNRIPNVTIVDDINNVPVGNQRIGLIPYVPPGRFHEAVAKFDPYPVSAYFCHQEFRGCLLGHKPSTMGDEWPLNNPPVISGHIHDYCRLQSNVLYVGIPRDTQFGSSDRRTVSLFELPHFTETRIDLGFPKRISIKVKFSELGSLVIPDNSITKVDISGPYSEIQAFKKTKPYLELSKKAMVVFSPTEIGEVVSLNTRQAGYTELLQSYCSAEDVLVQQVYEEVMREINT